MSSFFFFFFFFTQKRARENGFISQQLCEQVPVLERCVRHAEVKKSCSSARGCRDARPPRFHRDAVTHRNLGARVGWNSGSFALSTDLGCALRVRACVADIIPDCCCVPPPAGGVPACLCAAFLRCPVQILTGLEVRARPSASLCYLRVPQSSRSMIASFF